MSSAIESMVMVDRLIAEAVARSSEASVDEIVQKVKAMIDKAKEGREWLGCLPVQHLKNLIRKKIKENELTFCLANEQGGDDKIREELRAIKEDIQKTRPEFAIREMPFSPN